jgi:hypothetical protein
VISYTDGGERGEQNRADRALRRSNLHSATTTTSRSCPTSPLYVSQHALKSSGLEGALYGFGGRRADGLSRSAHPPKTPPRLNRQIWEFLDKEMVSVHVYVSCTRTHDDPTLILLVLSQKVFGGIAACYDGRAMAYTREHTSTISQNEHS